MQILDKYLRSIPPVFAPEVNTVINAYLTALATVQQTASTQTDNARDQLFVKTASGRYLISLANSRGVAKPINLGLSDADFRSLIPNLSLKPKQIKKAFYETADIFWGASFTHANITSTNFQPFNLSAGNEIKIKVDGGAVQTLPIFDGDIATGGAATAAEVVAILNRGVGLTASVLEDVASGNTFVNVRTNTYGSVGGLEWVTSSGLGSSKLNFTIGKVDILDLAQRFVVYQVNHNELIIEIPAVLPLLRRTLRGSHHFHADSTLESAVAPANGIWQGSFFFNPDGSGGAFSLTGQTTTLSSSVIAGSVLTTLGVADSSVFENTSGYLIFNFGKSNQEVPVKYRGIVNENAILLDPTHVFANTHASGSRINYIARRSPVVPALDGSDLAIYLASPSEARTTVQSILETLKAGGIKITFVVDLPEFVYLLDNPYSTADDAPSV